VHDRPLVAFADGGNATRGEAGISVSEKKLKTERSSLPYILWANGQSRHRRGIEGIIFPDEASRLQDARSTAM
jgi:hypothetical protein